MTEQPYSLVFASLRLSRSEAKASSLDSKETLAVLHNCQQTGTC